MTRRTVCSVFVEAELEDNGELIVEGEVNEREDRSGETIDSLMVSAAPIAPSAPADDTPPPEASPDNKQQFGFPSGRIDGEGIAPSPFLEEGDVAV